MKKVLFIMAAALMTMTQCRKQETMPVTPSAGRPVEMTVTVGPGSKTDIASTGGITWSTGDKLYVGDGSKYIGYLTLAGGVGTQTGTFTGGVGLADVEEGSELTFHFYYLGSADHTNLAKNAESVEVDFSSQDITKDGNGKLTNASKQHVCYGSAKGTVIGGAVTDINVMLVSKVAIARFNFKKGDADYAGALTLGGTNIWNKMTVNFDSEGFSCTGTVGDISLTNTTSSEKYVMLVPTEETTVSQALTFTGAGDNVSGSYTLEKGIEANKFYGMKDAIAVTLEAASAPTFTVDVNSTTVEFSPGNLQYLGKDGKWRFADNQWDILGAGPNATSNAGNVNLGSLGYTDGMYNTGSGNAGGSETDADKNAARDLFGWGATGYQDTRTSLTGFQTNYMPYSTSKTAVASSDEAYNKNRYGYGPDYDATTKYGLSVEAKSDWGAVPGLPPAGEGKTWRTLTTDEWVYLMNKRTASIINGTSNARYAEVKVNGVCGVMVFPDEFTWPAGVTADQPSTFNTNSSTWNDVDYFTADFGKLESAGVVFLPAAGRRNGTSLLNVGSYGYYWSSTCGNSDYAYNMYFNSGNVNPQNSYYPRYDGYSVRLVR